MNGSKIALLAAALLGAAGFFANLLYLTEKAKQFAGVQFIGIAKNVIIQPGDRFSEDKLVAVAIPEAAYAADADLREFGLLWSDRQTVVGMPAVRLYTGGELLLRKDLKTPPSSLALKGETERALWIPVDTRSFVASLVNPGDLVSFYVSDAPTPAALPPDSTASTPEETDATQPPPQAFAVNAKSDLIGPFRVLSVGNRLGSSDVLKASGVPQLQENVMTISVTVQGDQLEPKADRLLRQLRLSGNRQAAVILHPRPNK